MASRTRPPVRSLRAEERAAAARVLTRAFDDDPIMGWLLPPASRRRPQRMAHFYRFTLGDAARRRGAVLTTDDLAAVATWLAPGQPAPGAADALRGIPMGLTAIGPHNLPRAMGLLTTVQRAHPHEDHWYLQLLGSDPSRRGSGSAAALVERVLVQADEEGVGAYLESSKPENVPYYERFGFTVTEELHPADGCPPLWCMWRDPTPPGA